MSEIEKVKKRAEYLNQQSLQQNVIFDELNKKLNNMMDFRESLDTLYTSPTTTIIKQWYSTYHKAFNQRYLNIKTCESYEFRHTHHTLLEYHFMDKRSHYLQCIRSFISKHSKQQHFTNGNLLRLCKYFGFEQDLCYILTKERKFRNFYIDTIGATQKIDKLFKENTYSIKDCLVNNVFNIPFIVIECMHHITQKHEYDDIIFSRFIYYITLIECGLSCIHSTNNPRKCSQCKSKKNIKHLKMDTVRQAFLGYLMIFCTDNIYRKLVAISTKHLAEFLKSYAAKFKSKKSETYFIQKARSLKQIYSTLQNIKKEGVKHSMDSLCFFLKMMKKSSFLNGTSQKSNRKISSNSHDNCGSELFCNSWNNLMYHVNGKIYSLVLRDYSTAIGFLVVSCCTAFSLYERCISLRALSKNCYLSGQYLIGKKILKATYILCNGYILPIFVNKEYFVERKKFRRKLKQVKCANCDENDVGLRCCSGCMAVFYCSKKCQKLDWNNIHRIKCTRVWLPWHEQDVIDKGWNGAYDALEECIFGPLGLSKKF
eukprot:50060_1